MQQYALRSIHFLVLLLFLSSNALANIPQPSSNTNTNTQDSKEVYQRKIAEWPSTLHGKIDDCCCDIETVDRSLDGLHPLMDKLSNTTFFRYFKVNFYKDCPFWVEVHECSADGPGLCGVCEVPEDQIPEPWKNSRVQPTNHVTWMDNDEDIWIIQDETSEDTVYVDLPQNPERFTGYVGSNPAKIWLTIYKENCFPNPEECLEERVFYRLISGLHASTTAHIFEDHFDGVTWKPNPELFASRLGIFPDRLKNIYFTFLFLLRAANKASDFLTNYNYYTGYKDDQETQVLIKKLLSTDLLCSSSFDETPMFQGEKASLKRDVMSKFRNISEIMDCVACQTCKIHAKLQILGIGTALKILMAENKKVIESLQRNEIIALINTLHKFTESIEIIHKMKERQTSKTPESKILPFSIPKLNTSNTVLGFVVSGLLIFPTVFIFLCKNRVTKVEQNNSKKKKSQHTKNSHHKNNDNNNDNNGNQEDRNNDSRYNTTPPEKRNKHIQSNNKS